MKCSYCNRPLKDPASIKQGIGPVCFIRSKGSALTSKLRGTPRSLFNKPDIMEKSIAVLEKIGISKLQVQNMKLSPLARSIQTLSQITYNPPHPITISKDLGTDLYRFDSHLDRFSNPDRRVADEPGPTLDGKARLILAGLFATESLLHTLSGMKESSLATVTVTTIHESVNTLLTTTGLDKLLAYHDSKPETIQNEIRLPPLPLIESKKPSPTSIPSLSR